MDGRPLSFHVTVVRCCCSAAAKIFTFEARLHLLGELRGLQTVSFTGVEWETRPKYLCLWNRLCSVFPGWGAHLNAHRCTVY